MGMIKELTLLLALACFANTAAAQRLTAKEDMKLVGKGSEKRETALGTLTMGHTLEKGAVLEFNTSAQRLDLVSGLYRIQSDHAMPVTNSLPIAVGQELKPVPHITLIQDRANGEWLATDGVLIVTNNSEAFAEGHVIKIIGGAARPMRIAGEPFADTTVVITRGKPTLSKLPDLRATTKQQAKPSNWPDYTGELNGAMEVRVKNPNDFKVTVGLRSGRNGKDFTISPNDRQSVRVPNGRYDIYFQYSTDPDGLYQGDSFTLDNNGVEIQIIKVVDGNYGIRKVK